MMPLSKPRVIPASAAIAVVGGVAMLAYTALTVTGRPLPLASRVATADATAVAASTARPQAGEHAVRVSAPGPREARRDAVHVEAPSTRVGVDKTRGKVRVEAPYTNVKVDPDRGRVRVRAPYVNLDVNW
jgi:hypothetical protein